MTDSEIRDNIRTIRMSRGFKQEEVARRMGIGTNTFANLEKGPTEIIHKRIPELANILGVSIERLFLGFDPCPPDGDVLQSEINLKEQIKSLIEDYEKKLEQQRNKNEELEYSLKEEKEANKKLMEINAYLLAQLHKND